jgi:plastocyanin
MTTEELESRRARRAAARDAARLEPKPNYDHQAQRRSRRIRQGAFGLVVAAILAVGGYLAFGDLAGQRGAATTAEAIPVRLSMAGFTPSEVKVPAAQTVSLELWTTDAAPHLHNGVHTMISDELDIYEELPAAGPTGESRKVVTITTPTEPGTYDIYCDTCCGGKASPTMHGKLTVTA